MAKKEVIQVIDDLDGAALDEYETIEWSVDDKDVAVRPSAERAEEFGTPSPPISVPLVSSPPSVVAGVLTIVQPTVLDRTKEETQAIREWAQDNGYEVSDRGRISLHHRRLHQSAH